MAMLAASSGYSLAPKSNLYVVKDCGDYIDEDGKRYVMHSTPSGLHEAFTHIIQVVKDRDLQGKAVISAAWSKLSVA
jgi:hypothetical protein